MNENGQQLLKLCVFHNLCITNSFFKTKPQHKVSWRHPHSKHWHQLDLILVRHAAIKNVLHTRSYHSMDCDTDHSLVCCKIRLQPKKFHHAKKPGNPCIDISKMTQPDLMEQFAEAFEEEYGASPGAAPMSTGQSSVRQSRWPLQWATSEGCTKASRRHNQPWTQSSACQSWKSSMQSQLWISSAKPLTVWPQARHQAATVFLQTSSHTARPPYCTPCMKSSTNAGERELCCKT